MQHYLDFEKPIAELEGKVMELRHLAEAETGRAVDIAEDVEKLQAKAARLLAETYARLDPWRKTQVARHQDRPHFSDYVEHLVEDYQPLAGDRAFAEDEAMQGGLGRLRGFSVMLIGQEKGRDTGSRLKHNFGMAKPEGYRKAIRLMKLADRFHIPVVTLVDTAGAFPGVDAEARGQAEAIATSIATCLDLKTPILSAIIGEGGSGGAIALATANRIYMLEHSVYSVISPEGCASILWRSADRARDAATALKLTAQDLHGLKLIDAIISEPVGGAHRDYAAMAITLGDQIEEALKELVGRDGAQLRQERREKFVQMGRLGLK